jgi:hypothetical protein
VTVWDFLVMLAGLLFYGALFAIPSGIFVAVLYFVLRAARSVWERHRA